MMHARSILAMCVLASSLSGTVYAGELTDLAAEAERLLADEKPLEALAQIEAARDRLWQSAPLGFSRALFVTEPPAGYGRFTPRQSSQFRADEQLHVYAEPIAYDFREENGQYHIDLVADLELHNPAGQILARQDGFTTLSHSGRRPNREFQVSFTFSFASLKAGDYVLVTRLNDRNGGTSGTFKLPFSIGQSAPKEKPRPEDR